MAISRTLTVLCAAASLVTAAVAIWSFNRRSLTPAATSFGALMAFESLWNLGHLAETLSLTLHGKLLWDSLQNLPVAAVGPTALWFAFDYTHMKRKRAALWILAGVALVCALPEATEPLHGLLRPDAKLVGTPPVLTYPFQLPDLALALVTYSSVFMASGLLLAQLPKEHPLHASQTAALALSIAFPALGVLLGMSLGIHIDGDRDVSPVMSILGAVVAAWALARYRLFDVAHVGRNAVMTRLPDPVLVVDVIGRIVDVNPAAATIFGIPERASIGRLAKDALSEHPELLKVLAAPNEPDDVRIDDDEGKERWYSLQSTSLRDDRGVGVGTAYLLHEVTPRKHELTAARASIQHFETELVLSEERFRTLFDHAFQLFGLLSPDGRVVAANSAALALVGAREEDVIGAPFWETPWWRHSAEAQAQVRRAIADASSGQFVRFQTQHFDVADNPHDIDFSLTPVRDASGRVVELVPEGRDMTALHAEKARGDHLAAQLHQAQKLESIGRLAGGIAHDFNNLLTAIIGSAALAKRKAAPTSPVQELLDAIRQAALSATDISRQLLTFSRQQTTSPATVDLSKIVTRFEAMMRRMIREDVRIDLSIPPDLWLVRADPIQIEQALINLAVNAQDAMPEGGRLSFVLQNVDLADENVAGIPNGHVGQFVSIEVADTGRGIDPALLQNIFDPFFTTKPEGEGTGLGLAVVHGVIHQHGGFIRVESRPEHGTTFTLYLPRSEATGSVETATRVEDDHPHLTARVAVVEDQERVRKLVVTILEQAGHTVRSFRLPTELLDAAGSFTAPPDLLLTDVVLPQMNGVELARATKRIWPHTKVLFMSGYAPEDIVGARAIRADQLITKPFTPSELDRAVQTVLIGSETVSPSP